MNQPSATDSPMFRSLSGDELLEALTEHIKNAAAEVLSRASNHFSRGKAYPVASINAVIRIGLYHDTRQGQPYKSVDVPLKFWSFVRPDESISGLQSVLREDKQFEFHVGRSIESAPDAIRENHGLVVEQPQRQESGLVADAPVAQPDTWPRPCKLGCGKVVKSKAGEQQHQRFWCANNPDRQSILPEERSKTLTEIDEGVSVLKGAES